MQSEESMTSPERRCPTCGAAMPAEARFCGACGMEWTPDAIPSAEPAPPPTPAAAPVASIAAEAPPVAPPVASMAASAAVELPSAAAPATAPAAQPVEGRICPWCGAVNALDGATRCATCGAVFPTPEGDEALERAATARIQSMERELKPVRSGWWPFRGRQGQGA